MTVYHIVDRKTGKFLSDMRTVPFEWNTWNPLAFRTREEAQAVIDRYFGHQGGKQFQIVVEKA